jgi:pimeloyl-ACP methyl ester carboxylesterase
MYAKRFPLMIALVVAAAAPAHSADCVVFLHGLARTSASMEKAATTFEESGYVVANVDYPSRFFPIEKLAPLAVETGLEKCPAESVVHFVTHSLGGILVRYYLEQNDISNLGRVLMFAPPNKGSEVVDSLRHFPGFGAINGPAGYQLGTDKDSVPLMLGPVDYEVGVIAGTRTFNPILSQYLKNPDDGKISVENTKVTGMTDFLVVPHSHPFIMKSSDAIEQAFSFIETGQFEHEAP